MTSRVHVQGYYGPQGGGMNNMPNNMNNMNHHNGVYGTRQPAAQSVPMMQNGIEPSSTLLGVGVVMILLGLGALGVSIAGLVIYELIFSWTGVGMGIWAIVTGSVLVSASSSPDIGTMIAALVLSLLVLLAVWIPLAEYSYIIVVLTYPVLTPDTDGLILYGVLLVLGFLIFLLAIVSSVASGRLIHSRIMAATMSGGQPAMPQGMPYKY